MRKIKTIFNILFLAVIYLFSAHFSLAGTEYQRCQPDTNCILGEYLFDGDYNPVTGDVCTIDITDPTGTLIFDDAGTTHNSDGWHGYTFNASSPLGLYRSVMCCAVAPDTSCIDKSFILGISIESVENKVDLARNSAFDFAGFADSGTINTIVDAELTQTDDYWNNYKVLMLSGSNAGEERTVSDFTSADDTLTVSSAFSNAVANGDKYVLKRDEKLIAGIWNSTSRTLTSATNIASDIWGYSTKTLSSFGNLAADVWNDTYAPNRSLTSKDLGSGQSLATEAYLDSTKTGIESTVASDISALETNIENRFDSIDSGLSSLSASVDNVYADSQYVRGKVDEIISTLGDLTTIEGDLTDIKNRVGEYTNTSADETLFGRTKFLQEKWGLQTADRIYDQSTDLLNGIADIQAKIGYSGDISNIHDDILALSGASTGISNLVGDPSDLSSTATLFGRIKQNKEKIDEINNLSTEVDDAISTLGTSDLDETNDKIDKISTKISDLTNDSAYDLKDIAKVNTDNLDANKEIRNKLLDLRALLEINKSLLAKKPVVKTYYEWGSVVLKMVIVNPSDLKQTIDFEKLLPKEAKPEFVIDKSPDLNIGYNDEKEAWYVSESLELEAGQSVTKFVEVKDIWVISEDEINSLRNQADEFMKPLEKTAFFAQGATLKNDIYSRLDKISRIQKSESATPEEHIINYRGNVEELNAVKKDMEDLKKLITDVSSKNFLQGNIMGISTTMTWAIILMIIVGISAIMILLFVLIKRSRKREETEGEIRRTIKIN